MTWADVLLGYTLASVEVGVPLLMLCGIAKLACLALRINQ